MLRRQIRRTGWAISRYVRRAPGTHIYLLILLVTTAAVQSLHPVVATELLRQLSTNLTQMGRSAGRVLLLSAFLLDRQSWLEQLILFTAVYVPLERWVGTWRWLLIVGVSHIVATLVTTVGIWADVRSHRGGLLLAGTIDVGVSYGFFGGLGFLVWIFRRWWLRVAFAAATCGFLAVGLIRDSTYTDAGHAAAFAIGCSLYLVLGPAVTSRRPGSWTKQPRYRHVSGRAH